MDPLFYQNTYNVDWGELAQQWIKMKESLPPDQMHRLPDAPPPPTFNSADTSLLEKYYEEKGEAPMEVVKDDEADTNKIYQMTTSYSSSSKNYANNHQEKNNIGKSIQEQKNEEFFASAKQMKRKLLPAWIREGKFVSKFLNKKPYSQA